MRRIWITLFCLFIASAIASSAETLRIGLCRFNNSPKLAIASASGLKITDPAGKLLVDIPDGEELNIDYADGTIQYKRSNGEQSTAGSEVRIMTAPDAVINISTPSGTVSKYRGSLSIGLNGHGITVVNDVDIEDYVKGVLPSEMPSSFNIEALKAQAVAARTYAWANRGKHNDRGYDLCDQICCQIYPGAALENPSTTKAVKSTAGLIMTCEGKPISAQYSADCGGTTAIGGAPYLSSVSDKTLNGGGDYCEHDGHYWSKSWSLADLEKLFQKSLPELKGLKSIVVIDTDPTGRVNKVKLDADSGSVELPGAKLRRLLGLMVIKSTVFTVKVENGNAVFDGKGFGHGTGLCQWGANGLASPPNSYTYDQILKHYYTGIEIVPLSSLR